MSINLMAPLSSSAPPTANVAPAKTSSSPDALASKDTFLKLLVAQLKNQNPLSPTDGTQFVSQLAQFTTLEQSTQMRDDISAIRASLNQYLPATGAPGAGGADGSGSTNSTKG